ncbi:MAG: peptidylprolyl isomerase [Myxococcales bacterium]|nr:peptidylprolyl isomerase [Myxococcales bacterium]
MSPEATAPSDDARVAARRRIHLGVAEQGKLHALRGEHPLALQHYREAMNQAVRFGEPEVFYRHYLECALESLELMGALDEVVAWCDAALEHYRAHPPQTAVGARDLAHIHQRRGIALMKRGHRDPARAALAEAIELQDGAMPLAATLLRWIDSRLHCDAARITAEQRRQGFFSVRADTVDARRAVPLSHVI